MPRQKAAANSRKQNALIVRQKKANITMDDEDAGILVFDSTVTARVDYQMDDSDQLGQAVRIAVAAVYCFLSLILRTKNQHLRNSSLAEASGHLINFYPEMERNIGNIIRSLNSVPLLNIRLGR
jgi:hypothetical protein